MNLTRCLPSSSSFQCCQLSLSAASERVFIGLGANLGDRARTIRHALDRISDYAHVVDTSFMYQSEPLHVREQPSFLNAVAELRTSLSPQELLRRLKLTESQLGRTEPGIRYGPRAIDLDVLLYGEREFSDDSALHPITVPHPRIGERAFVLRPLADLDKGIQVPGSGSVLDLLDSVDSEGVQRVTPMKDGRLLKWEQDPLLMGIINTTPDSFSDGGLHNDVNVAVKQVERFVEQGFDIVDVGGYSTRPGAAQVDVDTEIARVLPVVQAISQQFPDVVISIDTFRGAVAEAALEVGADIVNDVGAGTWCEQMLPAVVRHAVPWIAMHCRGRPQNMMKLAEYGDDVPGEVAHELMRSLRTARRVGVHRWNVITDGGIGFAKNANHNAALIRGWQRFKTQAGDYPTLLGLSRKRFLAQACGSSAMNSRDWATAGALGMAVAGGGVDVVRVHEAEVANAVRTSKWLSG